MPPGLVGGAGGGTPRGLAGTSVDAAETPPGWAGVPLRTGGAGVSDTSAGPWYRILSIPSPACGKSAEADFVAVLPGVLSAAQRGRPFVIGWLSRGGGAPLELITNAGPCVFGAAQHDEGAARDVFHGAQDVRHGAQDVFQASLDVFHAQQDAFQGQRADFQHPPDVRQPARGSLSGHTMLFPNGAHGTPISDSWLAHAHRMVWTPCLGRQAPPLARDGRHDAQQDPHQPTVFESTLVTLMDRPFGWLLIAEPTPSVEAELAELRTQLTAMRRFDEERARLDVERGRTCRVPVSAARRAPRRAWPAPRRTAASPLAVSAARQARLQLTGSAPR